MGLPIPYIFLAEDANGKYEIVDGSQRIRTLIAFLNDDLKLIKLEKLPSINGLKFSNFDKSRQRKFINISLKMITLSEQTTDESKNDIFERINRGSDLLKAMESRKGIYRGESNNFIYELAKDETFKKLTPIASWFYNRQEHEELILRFFALSDLYPNKYADNIGIARQLDKYFEQKNQSFPANEKQKKLKDFNNVMDFVDKNTTYGFAKNATPQVSRVYFEALSIGVLLALKAKPNLHINKYEVDKLLNSKQFKDTIAGKYHTHTPKRINECINYIKNGLVRIT
jgi:hypothetical protein